MNLLFVYGTLLPGQANWHVLAPYVADEGWADAAAGDLFDTGLGWPAAVFADRAGQPVGRVVGRVVMLADATLDVALAALDEFEGIHEGAYRRIAITTDGGHLAWAYHSGEPGESPAVAEGDWAAYVNKQNG